MKLGAPYYPEHVDPALWRDDARRMTEAGLRIVRVGEFAWSRYEPRRGELDWGWLDEAIGILADEGLEIVLGTPTATPPIWLALERPDIRSVGPDGRRRDYGVRRFSCPTSAAYREEAHRIVSALVERYGQHPAIVAFQIDNEPGNHDSARCWCDECQAAFARWLEDRYGTVDALNHAWGTVFWSQVYPSFESVRLPAEAMTPHSPSLLLAHRRFSSGQMLDFLERQREIVRAGAPGREMVTNVWLGDLHVDAREIAAPTGIAGPDLYPDGQERLLLDAAFNLDLGRGLAGQDGRLWVMELQPGQIHFVPNNRPVAPGQVRLWAWQAALHGAELAMFFSWRPTRSGQEQYHAGLVGNDGFERQGLTEARQVAGEFEQAPAAILERPPAEVAVLYDWQDAWALEIDPHHPSLTHRDYVVAAYEAARRLGFEVDVVHPLADLTRYRAVLAPALHLACDGRAEHLAAAADAGVLVAVGVRSLCKDAEDCNVREIAPAGLAERLGIRVVEGLAHYDEAKLAGEGAFDGCAAGGWVDHVELLDGAEGETEVLASFAGATHLAGKPATVRRGRLLYHAASSCESWSALLRDLLGGSPGTADQETFARGDARILLDQSDLSVTGLPASERVEA